MHGQRTVHQYPCHKLRCIRRSTSADFLYRQLSKKLAEATSNTNQCWHSTSFSDLDLGFLNLEYLQAISTHPTCLSGYDHWSLCLVRLCTTWDDEIKLGVDFQYYYSQTGTVNRESVNTTCMVLTTGLILFQSHQQTHKVAPWTV